MELEAQFDVSGDRALRITTLVRQFTAPEYDDVMGEYGSDQFYRHKTQLVDRLDESLAEQPGDSIEERWNNPMDELNCQTRTENGVCLILWDEHDSEDWRDLGVSLTRPE